MRIFYKENQQGFIALISIIIIAAVLTAIVFVLSTAGFFLRFNVFDSESKKASLGLAEACMQTAMLNLAQGSLTVPQTVSVGAQSCKICDKSGTGIITLKTRAVYNKSYSNVTAVLVQSSGSFTVNSWDDQASYLGPSCQVF